MAYERRWIVQDRESCHFLGTGDDGDIDFFPYVNRAFQFDDEESAALTGHAVCGAGFVLYQFYIPVGLHAI